MNPTQSYCDIGLERTSGATIVTVKGEVDLFAAPLLEQALDRARESGAVVVDLSNCAFFESSGLNALLRLDLDTAAPKITVVRPPSSCADRMLALTVPGHFSEHDSRDAALAAVAG